jgi:hypothetical protein
MDREEIEAGIFVLLKVSSNLTDLPTDQVVSRELL